VAIQFKCGKILFVGGQIAMDPACCDCCCCDCTSLGLTLSATGDPALSNLNASFGPFTPVAVLDPSPGDGEWCGYEQQGPGDAGVPIPSWDWIGVAFQGCDAMVYLPQEFKDSLGRSWIFQGAGAGWRNVSAECKCFPITIGSAMYSLFGNPSGPWATINLSWDCLDWGD
jgi:hypothetical protein